MLFAGYCKSLLMSKMLLCKGVLLAILNYWWDANKVYNAKINKLLTSIYYLILIILKNIINEERHNMF